MKVEMHSNFRITIQLTPENDLERTALRMMLEAAERGSTVAMGTFSANSVDGVAVAVDIC